MMRLIVTAGVAAAVHAFAGEQLLAASVSIQDKIGAGEGSIQRKAVRGLMVAGVPAIVGAIVASRLG